MLTNIILQFKKIHKRHLSQQPKDTKYLCLIVLLHQHLIETTTQENRGRYVKND